MGDAGPDDVVIRVQASSLNYHDVFTRRGMPGIKLPFPVIIGLDVAGIVEQTGANVRDWKPGDRVLVDPIDRVDGGLVGETIHGGLAELCRVPAHQLLRLPDEVSFDQAAALPVAYGTALRMMNRIGQVQPGEKVLILGASYGSLLGVKLALAGHAVKLVCLPQEAELINAEGAIVRMPVKGREGLVEVRSRDLPGKLTAAGTGEVDPRDFDLVGLAMQEPQYRSAGVRELLESVARAKVPCLSIMNMPPLPYLARIGGIDAATCTESYTDASVWQDLHPRLTTLCSPDPQAFRPPEEEGNVLQVRLATNFKAARFESDAHTAILRELAADIDAARLTLEGEALDLPVKLKVHDSVFVPLAKWAMLMAGNYRCLLPEGIRTIRDAVHADLEATQSVYEWVCDLCVALGADREDMVPFEKYPAAAQGLVRPSSAARALFAGAPNIERVDRLVQAIGVSKGMRNATVDKTVALVDAKLAENRKAAA